MSKAEWGTKRVCPSCGTRYYDMKKNPPVCPNCGTAFDPETLLKTRRRAAPEAKKVEEPPPVIEDTDDIETEEGEEAVIENAEELGDENSELEEVVEIKDEDTTA